MAKVLIACEFSGLVRDAFARKGHNAISFDLLPNERSPYNHIRRDVIPYLNAGYGWDLMIAFPPCTHLAVSGARWFKDKVQEQKDAIEFVEKLWNAPIPKICIENPIGILSTRSSLGKPAQIIQPWQYGHGEVKATCLWLKGLPLLQPTNIVAGRIPRVHHATPGPDRWKERSRTLEGIANAFAEQWG